MTASNAVSEEKPNREAMRLETISGLKLDVLNPAVTDISLGDIAYALARIPRYNGHCNSGCLYSYALSSIWLARYLCKKTGNANTALQGLFNAAYKAYTGVIPAPILASYPLLKQELTAVEETIQRSVMTAMNMLPINANTAGVIADAKAQMMSVEAKNLIQSKGHGWSLPTIDKHAKSIELMTDTQTWSAEHLYIACVHKLNEGELL